MIVTKALINFNTHHAVVAIDDLGTVRVFKYSDEYNICDLAVFAREDQMAAGDYILEPLPALHYYVNIDGEIPLHRE